MGARTIRGAHSQSEQREPLNDILGAIETESRSRIEPYLEHVKFRQGSVLCEAGSTLSDVYFPQSCVLSLMTVTDNGATVATASIGSEGVFGPLPGLHSEISFSRCVVPIAGNALRLQSNRLNAEFEHSQTVRGALLHHTEQLLVQVQQTAACNALHPTGARMCRWLLMMHDRAGTDTMALTHEFLAAVLGANRTTVSIAASALQSLGIISYRRGRISILDRPRLERASCDCYTVMRRHNASS